MQDSIYVTYMSIVHVHVCIHSTDTIKINGHYYVYYVCAGYVMVRSLVIP